MGTYSGDVLDMLSLPKLSRALIQYKQYHSSIGNPIVEMR